MAYTLKKKLANSKNYGSKRSIDTIKYIVIHYTANDGDTDEGNGKYFANNVVKASAHYFVDDDSVTQSVPDNYVAWSVGGSKYNNDGGRLYGKATNTNTLNIEICDDVKDGKVYPSAKTIENVVAFTKTMMKKYGIKEANVIRHYDVNGKACPKYWVDDSKWKKEFHDKLTDKPEFAPYTVKITTKSLNVRKGPGVLNKVVTSVKMNEVYTIVDAKNGWGLLKSYQKNKDGWIKLSYTKRL